MLEKNYNNKTGKWGIDYKDLKKYLRPMREEETIEEYHDDTYFDAVEKFHADHYHEWVQDISIATTFKRVCNNKVLVYKYRVVTEDEVIEGDIDEIVDFDLENIARVIDTAHYLGWKLDIGRLIEANETWYRNGNELIEAAIAFQQIETTV